MLFDERNRRHDPDRVRRIKETVRERLALDDETTVTVSELACLEEGCPPRETVIGVLRKGHPSLQAKLHKSLADLGDDDIALLCQRLRAASAPSRTTNPGETA